jgi:HEAT repeat protein
VTSPGFLIGFIAVLAVASVLLTLLVATTRILRTVQLATRQARVAPYRNVLLTIGAGEDDDGAAAAALYAAPPRVWAGIRVAAVGLLDKVRGEPAVQLVRLLDRRGELARALRGLRSPSAIRRARHAHLLGLARRDEDVEVLLPLLADRSAEVRLVAARALGLIGAPRAARALFDALRPVRGQPAVPTGVVAEALLGMGMDTIPAVTGALRADDVNERTVATLVAADSAVSAVLPSLRRLLTDDEVLDVRIAAATAIGAAGGPKDVGALARHTGADQPTALRRAAATALGELGHPAAAPVLAALLSDADVRLAQLCGEALVRLGDDGVTVLTGLAGAAEQPAAGPGARIARGALALARLRGEVRPGDAR